MSSENSSGEESPRFVSEEFDQARLDKTVKLHFELPWSKARTWIETGKVFIDGNPILDLDFAVSQGQRIELRMGTPRAKKAGGLAAKNVIYFDSEIVIVDKPAGMMSVPHPQSPETATLDRLTLDYLRIHDKGTNSKSASLGVVHRIDKETSGLIVFARSYTALQRLSTQFREHTIERKYYALAHGKVKSQPMKTRIARDNGMGIRGSVPAGKKNSAGEELGRTAITHFEAVEALEGATLVSCRLETGRTHQIRIHLSEAGHPIIGERVYARDYSGVEIGANRVMLHAAELGFLHPETGEPVKWKQALPKDFQKKLKALGGKTRVLAED